MASHSRVFVDWVINKVRIRSLLWVINMAHSPGRGGGNIYVFLSPRGGVSDVWWQCFRNKQADLDKIQADLDIIHYDITIRACDDLVLWFVAGSVRRGGWQRHRVSLPHPIL